MNGQYKDGMIYPPLPKQTEGYHGDYWTDDDLTGYALDFWKANTTPQPAQADTTAGDGMVVVPRELTHAIANAMGWDSATHYWEEYCQTWTEVLQAAAAPGSAEGGK